MPDASFRDHRGGRRPGDEWQRRDPGARFDVGDQRASTINNVARDQVNLQLQLRDDFLRRIAATKTKARWMIGLGFVLIVVGFAAFASGVLSFIAAIPSIDASTPPDQVPSPFGGEVFGVPTGILGWSSFAIGIFVVIAGIVGHVVATSRRKRVDREFPLPATPSRGRRP